jgi:transposase-like protein
VFKQSVVARMASAESIRGLAAELKVDSRMLYHWRDRFQTGGLDGLRRVGRPARIDTAKIEASPTPIDITEPSEAQRRIEELERKIGQQQLDLDFFRAALRHVRERRLKKGEPGDTTSTR